MVVAMLIYFQRNNLRGVTFVALVTGVVGGIGFATGVLLKLIEMKSGLETNWHSILEQSYGLINGLGVAIAMELTRTRAPRVADDGRSGRWPDAFAVAFLLLLLTYLNLQKEVNDWIGAKAIHETLYFLTTRGWFDLFYLLTALAVLALLAAHLRRPLALVPPTWLGKGQMLYLMLLWWMIIGNLTKALVAFAPQRLVTEGTIHINGLLCTLMVLLWARTARQPTEAPESDFSPLIHRTAIAGLVALVLVPVVEWGVVQAIYGDKFAGNAGNHVRFGPDANTAKE
jgi:hypothetical protein